MKTAKKVPWRDPIVEEIRQNWEKYAQKFDFDLDQIFQDLMRQQDEHPERLVSFARETSTAASPPTAPARPSKRRDT